MSNMSQVLINYFLSKILFLKFNLASHLWPAKSTLENANYINTIYFLSVCNVFKNESLPFSFQGRSLGWFSWKVLPCSFLRLWKTLCVLLSFLWNTLLWNETAKHSCACLRAKSKQIVPEAVVLFQDCHVPFMLHLLCLNPGLSAS